MSNSMITTSSARELSRAIGGPLARRDFPVLVTPSGNELNDKDKELTFSIETLRGKERVESMACMLLTYQKTFSLYAGDKPEPGTLPVCTAPSEMIGHLNPDFSGGLPRKLKSYGLPSGNCKSCPFNVWGEGNAPPLCRRHLHFFVLPHDMRAYGRFPIRVQMAVTQMEDAVDFVKKALRFNVELAGAWVRLGLRPSKTNGGTNTAVVTISLLEDIPRIDSSELEAWKQIAEGGFYKVPWQAVV